ncbi:hypothetical protein LSUB1_G004983 [Lachnellula subtilissima]|uniref:Yeast cell wall synthesis Kre9/Knh1-like N-terminal domain-containing protein n=1 Tax=Lachnellula subtilissima TaxID=602034 RepID=A0A8H8U7R8_9HELO|nr:hypothetical protein LSUB1_G004983 [Lachnellula subtilissima]
MQFTSLLFAAAALVGVNAAVNLTNTDYVITVGKTFSIGWAGASGPVTLTLKNGAALDLKTVSTITSGSTTSPYVWTVPSDLPIGNYAIEITDGTTTNYSPDFGLMGATATTSLAVSTSASPRPLLLLPRHQSQHLQPPPHLPLLLPLHYPQFQAQAARPQAPPQPAAETLPLAPRAAQARQVSSGSSSSKTSSASSSTSSSSVPNANSAAEIASPLALVFLTFAAVLSLN